ncbi:hypothetical protein CLF_113344, partial [Clonorchis sinensis]
WSNHQPVRFSPIVVLTAFLMHTHIHPNLSGNSVRALIREEQYSASSYREKCANKARLEIDYARADQVTLRIAALTLWRQLNFAAKPQMLCDALYLIKRKQLAKLVAEKYHLRVSSEKEAVIVTTRTRHLTNKLSNLESGDKQESPLMSAMTRAIQRYILPLYEEQNTEESSPYKLISCPEEKKWFGLPTALTQEAYTKK